MPYIGNTVQTQGFTPQIDYFNGNGSTVTFTLSRPVVSVAQMIVAVDNVIQNPSSAYTVSGSSITFTSAPLSGTNNIWVEYTSLITTYAALSQSPSVVGDITASGGYLAVGNFGASFVDGTIVDYVTGNGRITTGPADGFTIYNGGTSARSALTTWDSSGNVGIGTASPKSNGTNYTTLTLNNTNNGGVVEFTNNNNTIAQIYNNSTDLLIYGNTNKNVGLYTTGTGVITANTGGSERMRIDSSGYVTKPYQVAFHVRVNTASYITTSPIPFSNAVFNVGNAFNTSTYTFTAPVAGKYMFVLNGYMLINGVNKGSTFWLNVNGSDVAYADNSVGSGATGNTYVTTPLNAIRNLSAGDTVYWRFSGSSGCTYYGGNQETNLYGYLLG
jgi:hypothetical protein